MDEKGRYPDVLIQGQDPGKVLGRLARVQGIKLPSENPKGSSWHQRTIINSGHHWTGMKILEIFGLIIMLAFYAWIRKEEKDEKNDR